MPRVRLILIAAVATALLLPATASARITTFRASPSIVKVKPDGSSNLKLSWASDGNPSFYHPSITIGTPGGVTHVAVPPFTGTNVPIAALPWANPAMSKLRPWSIYRISFSEVPFGPRLNGTTRTTYILTTT